MSDIFQCFCWLVGSTARSVQKPFKIRAIRGHTKAYVWRQIGLFGPCIKVQPSCFTVKRRFASEVGGILIYSDENDDQLIFCTFAKTLQDNNTTAKDFALADQTVTNALEEYNETNAAMNLVRLKMKTHMQNYKNHFKSRWLRATSGCWWQW